MKLTKTIACAAILGGTLLAGNVLLAQDSTNKPAGEAASAKPGKANARPGPDQIAKELNLTAEQKTKFKAAFDEQMQKMRDIRSQSNLSQDEKRAKSKEVRDGFQAKLKEILTPEQFEKWQKNMHQRRPQGGPGGKPEGGKPAKQD